MSNTMREILFRGKRVENGKWVYGMPVETEAENGVKEFIISRAKWESDDNSIDFLETDVYEIDPETVGQITGLTDKNGNKIFEGDIVTGYFDHEKIIGAITYGSDATFFIQRNRLFGIGLNNAAYWLSVIGNVHDNPELLEVNNDL